MTLKKKALRGVRWTSFSMLMVSFLQLAQMSILARFLRPEDFGLMSIVVIVIGFSQAFQDMGLSNAIIQKSQVSHVQLSSLYWLNLASGICLCGVMFGLSPVIASFYGEPRIIELVKMVSSIFILVALGNQYRALCQKDLDFKAMELINVLSSLTAFITSVVLAINGFGVWSLVSGVIVQSGIGNISFLIYGLKKYHKPSLVFNHSEIRGFYSFGLYQMGEGSINYISANSDKLLLGKFVGIPSVGVYNLAWQLIIFPLSKINPIINKVAFPVYSKVQNDKEILNRYYSLIVKALLLITVPVLVFLMFFSRDLVLVLFGNGWVETSDLLAVLSLVGILKALGNPGGALMLALGKAHIGFWWNLVWAIFVVLGLVVGLSIWPEVKTVVYVLLFLSLTLGVCWHILIVKVSGVDYRQIIFHLIKLFTVSMLIAWLGSVISTYLALGSSYFRLIIGGLFCGIAYLSYIFIFEKEMLRIVFRSK